MPKEHSIAEMLISPKNVIFILICPCWVKLPVKVRTRRVPNIRTLWLVQDGNSTFWMLRNLCTNLQSSCSLGEKSGHTDTDRDTDRDRHTHTDRHRDRHTQRHTQRDIDRETHRDRHRHRHTDTDRDR